MKKSEEQLTFADLDLPKTRGRPRKPEGQKLTPAERAKRYRDKKRAQGVHQVQMTKEEAITMKSSSNALRLYALSARIACKFDLEMDLMTYVHFHKLKEKFDATPTSTRPKGE